ncbi:MAG: tRNA-guanine transglycosylase DpdA [Candidatus Thermochlorobacter sp.]
MKYFLPDWEDRVYPNFNFEDDFSPHSSQDAYKESVYAHEIFKKPPYDGVLISLALYSKKYLRYENGTPNIRGFTNIREYLRLNRHLKHLAVMGDCGAFSYVNEEKPPVTPQGVANLYHQLDFDLGISPDHIIVDSITIKGKPYRLSEREKQDRRKISLDNAAAFSKYVRQSNMRFTPIGVAQGYDEQSYGDSVNQLLDMNYEYIAIGGLVRYPTIKLKSIVEHAMQQIHARRRKVKVHLLGVLRPELLPRFQEIGTSSFDSASFMRKAWLRSTMNYLGADGKWYSAIRIPQTFNPNIIRTAQKRCISETKLKSMERQAMQAICSYTRKQISLESTLAAVMEYDQLLERSCENLERLHQQYRRTLESRIWEQCPCEICRSTGIHVVIFRGTNRNKRRGMHNTWTFYQQFKCSLID